MNIVLAAALGWIAGSVLGILGEFNAWSYGAGLTVGCAYHLLGFFNDR